MTRVHGFVRMTATTTNDPNQPQGGGFQPAPKPIFDPTAVNPHADLISQMEKAFRPSFDGLANNQSGFNRRLEMMEDRFTDPGEKGIPTRGDLKKEIDKIEKKLPEKQGWGWKVLKQVGIGAATITAGACLRWIFSPKKDLPISEVGSQTTQTASRRAVAQA